MEQTTEAPAGDRRSAGIGYAVAGVLVVLALGAATRLLEAQVPRWANGTSFEGVAKSIEFPVYAIALGLLGNVVLSRLVLRDARGDSAPSSSSRPAWSCSARRSTSRSSSPLRGRRSSRRCC